MCLVSGGGGRWRVFFFFIMGFDACGGWWVVVPIWVLFLCFVFSFLFLCWVSGYQYVILVVVNDGGGGL